MEHISRDEAFALLKKYNKDPFHIQHALTVEAVMKWYANELGYSENAEYWGIVGLLHDIDFELYPEEHCIKAPELLREGGVSEDIIHGVVSHGYGITVDVAPEHQSTRWKRCFLRQMNLQVLYGRQHLCDHPRALRIWNLSL